MHLLNCSSYLFAAPQQGLLDQVGRVEQPLQMRVKLRQGQRQWRIAGILEDGPSVVEGWTISGTPWK